MASFPRDLILEIAEKSDIHSLLRLSKTSKEINELLKTYECSLTKSRLADFPVPPLGDILSSELRLRRLIKYGSFQMLLELNKRKSRIEEILTACPHFNLKSPPGLGELTNPQQKRLCALLYRAIAQCDHIADLAANAPKGPPATQWYKPEFIEWWVDRGLPLYYREKDPYTNYLARPAQQEYIRNLAKQDCTVMYYLMNMMGSCWANSRRDWFLSDPAFYERIIAFKECVLRHGSWCAWAHLIGGGEWESMTDDITRIGLAELNSFECGDKDAQCSLQSVLIGRFNELHESPDNGQLTSQQAVIRLITADIDDSDNGGQEEGEDQDEEDQE
ncbi:hypothetical protein F5Y00DRAFT_258051 [Daldinia vernicosa]|uniref:uncharacterized protein n=1 Tax=Daldinia vernicosa TaxID=114800 RepID=UPI00200826BD|nr:uncharacterized protein F5Y00DRAFT_258051 [Daldinia vernicosa]KAI0852794.1 hypothetical protein F5Y00DRAFT_258051 [Daldinia vernicosa]